MDRSPPHWRAPAEAGRGVLICVTPFVSKVEEQPPPPTREPLGAAEGRT